MAKILTTIVSGKNGFAIALLILAVVCALPLLGAVDLDGDGIADAWEWMHGARDADPEDDPDADGSNAFEESVAGTDPNDPSSTLGLEGLVQLPDGSLLARWFGEAGKQYVLEGRTNIVGEEIWEELGSGSVSNQSGVMSVVLPADFSERAQGRLRLAVSDVDSDGDGLNDWEEALFGLDPTQGQSSPGVNDYDVALSGLAATNVVEIEIVPATITDAGSAQVVVRRSGVIGGGTMGVQPLLIALSTSGSLAPGRDLNAIPETLFMPMFSNDVAFTITPTGVGFPGPSETLSISVQSVGDSFVVGLASQAVLTVEYTRPTFFAAQLRNSLDPFLPTIGTATLAVNPDRTQADLQVAFDGPEAPTDFVQLTTTDHVFFAGLPQVTTVNLPAGFLDVLESTNLHVNIGDFSGVFQLADGGQTFDPPAPLSPWPNVPLPDAAAASRFLAQCTFGPTPASIASVESLGFETWIDQQMALPASHHLPFVANHGAFYPTDQSHRIESWWDQSVRAPDQLRQRVAFALSQIFVISDRDSQIINYPYGTAAYNDLLLDGAFGSYRDLLEAVSLHPMMGMYLSHVRNQPVTSMSFPDENYAREVMQLFSIGLWQLHPDGSRMVGPGGGPIPTYDQAVVEEMARVFTGWSFHNDNPQFGFYSAPVDEVQPMQLYDFYHDDGLKTLLDGVVLPAGQGGEADLDAAMTLLAEHPNTGPFIAFRLIQRLVTSNPSPGYVYRVGQVFQTTNGDLGAVVKAILLDPEARDPALVTRSWRGLLREPLLRATGLFRAFGGTTPSTRFRMISPYRTLTQGPLQSPSVFNFFDPEFRLPGEVADAGLRSPVFQILNANNAVLLVNAMFETVESGMPSGVEVVTLDLADEIALGSDPAALVDHLDVLLMHGDMSASMRSSLLAHLDAVPVDMPAERARSAVHLIVVSPEYVVMK